MTPVFVRTDLSAFTPAADITVSQISMATAGTAASGVTWARMGLYEIADSVGSNSATLIAQTAQDSTLFTSINTLYTRSFSTAGGYPASVTLVTGRRYAVAQFMAASTMGNRLAYAVGFAGVLNTLPWLSGRISDTEDMPATGTVTRTSQGIWGRLS